MVLSRAKHAPSFSATLHQYNTQVGLSLSGFPHNGVSVFGGLAPMPVILSDAVVGLRPAFVWMGGGHPLLKLGVSTNDLANGLGAVVVDISVPRDGQSPEVEDDEGAS